MKEFYEQCLKDLESLTGIKQLVYLEMEAKKDEDEAKRKIGIIIRGMVEQSKRFPYIPEDEQKEIILEAIVTDQDFEALNSRTVYKWLNAHKERFWSKAQRMQTTEQELTPAPKEVADKYAEEFYSNLKKIGNPDQKKIVDPQILKLREKIGTGAPGRPEWIVGELCGQCGGTGLAGPSPEEQFECTHCNGIGKVNAVRVHATSQEEADKAYQTYLEQL